MLRWCVILAVGVLLCGGAAAISRWANPNVSAVSILSQSLTANEVIVETADYELRYGPGKAVTLEDITPDVQAVLDRLRAEITDLQNAVDQTERALVKRDPHLAKALADPYDTPLRGDSPRLQRDVMQRFLPELDAMVEDYLATTSDDAELVERIAEPMRRVLRATLLRQPIAPEDLAVLTAARDAGADDPLLLFCLFRVYRGNEERQFPLLKQAQSSRSKRKVCASVGALISSNLALFKKQQSSEEYHNTTECFIADSVALWRHYPSYEEHFAAQDFFLDYTNVAFDRLNASGKADLLVAISETGGPPVPSWLPHFLAARLLEEAAATYRGTDYISAVSQENLRLFGELSEQSTVYLLKAWTLAPAHSVLAAKLLSTEMWAGTTPRSADAWFRHALSARMRVHLAFDAYETSVQERWGGSFEKQLWLAGKYVEIDDLDSGIPPRAMHLLWTLSHDQALCQRIGLNLTARQLTSKLVRALKTHSREAPHESINAYALAMAAFVLWEAGEFDDLVWLMTTYADRVDCKRYFHEKRLHAGEILEMARAILTDKSGCWLTIKRHLYGDTRSLTLSDLDQTDLALAELRSLDNGRHRVRTELIRSCERRAKFLRRFMNHELITLSDSELRWWVQAGNSVPPFAECIEPGRDSADTAPLRVAADFAGVVPSNRSLQVDQEMPGSVEMPIWIPGLRGVLACPVELELPLSFSMDIEELEPGADPYGISLMIGPTVPYGDQTGYVGPILTLSSAQRQVLWDRLPIVHWNDGVRVHEYSERQEKYTLKIEAFPDGYRLFFGDQVLDTVRMTLKTGGLVQLGRYVSFAYPGMTRSYVKYRVSNVQLQKLNRPSIHTVPAS